MKILQSNIDKNLLLNSETDFRTDLGWEESFQEFEQDTLKSIINPAVNFETVRYIHKSCLGVQNIEQPDIWFYFYFYNNQNPQTHVGGLNYEYIGLTTENNSKILREDNESFFRLEFYKVPEGKNPNSSNRKLVFTKHLSVALGEKIKYSPNNQYIYVPIFMGSNFRNKENMYLFWFQDNTVMDGTLMSGNTFYMTARFFNTIDGTMISFTNIDKGYNDAINEETDVYYKMEIERTGYTYMISSGITEFGCSANPIRFYAASDSISSLIPLVTPSISISSSITPTITVSNTITPSLTPSVTPTITVSNSLTPSITLSVTLSNSLTPSVTPTMTKSNSVMPSITPSVTPTITKSNSVTPSLTPTITVSNSSSPSLTPTMTKSNSVTPSITSSITPTITVSNSISPSITPSVTPTITISNSLTPSVTPTPSPAYSFMLAATGDGSGVATLAVTVSTTTTFTLDGVGRFYTDAGGLSGATTTWSPTAGATRTIYVRCSGSTANMWISANTVTKWGNNTTFTDGFASVANGPSLSGDISKLTALTDLRIFSNFNTLSGNVALLTDLTGFCVRGNNTISGSVAGLTSLTILINESATSALSGSVAGLTSLTWLKSWGNNTLSGSINALTNLTYLYVVGTNTVSGDLKYISDGLTICQILGNNQIVDYTSGGNWSGITAGGAITINPATSYGLSSAEMDLLLQEIAATKISGRAVNVTLQGSNAARTAFSNAAVNAILADGGTVATNETLGAELVTNGAFTGWTGDNPDGWDISGESGSDPMITQVGNAARLYSSSATVNIHQHILTVGHYYKCIFTITASASGGIAVGSQEAGGDITGSVSAIKTYVIYFSALTNVFSIKRGTATGDDVTFTNVSVKEVTENLGSELIVNSGFTSDTSGWSALNWVWETDGSTGGWCRHTTGYTSSAYQVIVQIGHRYKVSVIVGGITAGTVSIRAGSETGLAISSNGTYTTYRTCSGDTNMRFTPTADFDGYIDNASVKEVL